MSILFSRWFGRTCSRTHGRIQVASFGSLMPLAIPLPCPRYLKRKPMVLGWATAPQNPQAFPGPAGGHPCSRHEGLTDGTFDSPCRDVQVAVLSMSQAELGWGSWWESPPRVQTWKITPPPLAGV